jgi:hypothetical protein
MREMTKKKDMVMKMREMLVEEAVMHLVVKPIQKGEKKKEVALG